MQKVLEVLTREALTKGSTNRLRREGRIPAIVYGHEKPKAISVDAHQFSLAFRKINESEIITLKLGKAEHKVLIKDYQRNTLKGTIEHLDFYEIEKDRTFKTKVPLKLTGAAQATRDGGILENALHELEIECLASALPEVIEIDVSQLIAGHAMHVRDLKLATGIRVLTNPEQVIASITHAKAEAAPAVEAAAPAAAATPAAAPAAAKPTGGK